MSTPEDEAKRAAMAEELAQVNVLRVSQVIGHAGVALLDQLAASRGQMPATVLVTNAMLLANAVHANEKNRAMAFRKKPAALTGGGPLKRLEMVRLALPGQQAQVAAGPAPAAAAAQAGGAEAGEVASTVRGRHQAAEETPARAAAPMPDDTPALEPEVITHDDPTPDPDATPDPDEMPSPIQFASQAVDLALAAAAETAPDPLASAVLRAMARSRARAR